MRHVDRFARTLAFVLLFLTWTDGGAAEFAAPTADGWHVWQVRSSSSDRNFDDIYVQMRAGKVTDIEIQTSTCSKTAAAGKKRASRHCSGSLTQTPTRLMNTSTDY